VIEQARWVIDTNLLISRLLTPRGTAAQAVDRAVELGILLVSDDTLEEFTQVMARPRFDPYITAEDRQGFMALLTGVARRIHVTRQFQVCRDPKDNKFLDVAFNGRAHAIVTGDQDLLVLQSFHGVAILAPAQFLAEHPAN
jgi:putative PIN family toxin of toxin-antitoxin system